jgi:hypothetical protein
MFVRTFAILIAIGMVCCGSVEASIISLIRGNDQEAIFWLANHHNPAVTGLDLIVKENTPGALEGPAQGGWSLSGQDGDRSASWTLSAPGYTPEFFFVKFDGVIAIYSYDGPGSSPFSGSYDLDADVWDKDGDQKLKINVLDKNNLILFESGLTSDNGTFKKGQGQDAVTVQVGAEVSHVSVYGFQTAIPEPGTMTIWAVGCLAVMGSRLRRRS